MSLVKYLKFHIASPNFFKRYGIKITLIVGMLAWVVRYIFLVYGDAAVENHDANLGVILHGIFCYDFSFCRSNIY